MFLIFGPQLLDRRMACRAPLLLRPLLRLLPPLLARGELVSQVVREDSSEGRVRSGIERGPLRATARSSAQPAALDIAQGVPNREQRGAALEQLLAGYPQRRVVVEDIKTAPERTQHEVIFPTLDREITHRDRRHAAGELDPLPPAVDCEVRPELGAHKQQLRIDVVLGDTVDDVARWQVASDVSPRPPAIGAAEHVGYKVAVLMIVERGEHGVGVVPRGGQAAYVGHLGHARKRLDLPPVSAAVLGDLDQPVVGADVDQPLGERRLRQRNAVAKPRCVVVLGDRVGGLNPAHDLQGVTIEAARQVVADDRPTVAAIVGAEQSVGGEIQSPVIVRTEDQRRVPVPAIGLLARGLPRLDIRPLAAAPVEAHQAAVLPLAVDNVRIFRVNLRLVAVAANRDEPVFVRDTDAVARARRAAQCGVVLRAAIDVVERRGVVDADAVELRDRQVGLETPVLAAVKTLIHAAVTANEQVVGVARVDPERVIIHVAVLARHALERLPAIFGHVQERIQGVDPVHLARVADDLVVVLGAGRLVVATLLPGLTTIHGSEEPALVIGRLDDGVDDVRIGGRDVQADSPHVYLGQPLGELAPGFARVG